jgi:hypothetical protein
MKDKKTLYRFDGLLWDTSENRALCPVPNCFCELEDYEDDDLEYYTYKCIKCEFTITSARSIYSSYQIVRKILESDQYKNSEIINLDGDSIRVAREQIDDSDYWADVKISKNKKGQIQLMVLAGSKKENDKAQLFIEPKNEKLSFDQNNLHPKEVFVRVDAIFRDSNHSIKSNKQDDF